MGKWASGANLVSRKGIRNRRTMKEKVIVDSKRIWAQIGKKRVDLAPIEFKILLSLAQADGVVLDRKALGKAAEIPINLKMGLRLVDQHVCRLRRKVPGIETVTGFGYRAPGITVI